MSYAQHIFLPKGTKSPTPDVIVDVYTHAIENPVPEPSLVREL